MALGLAVCLAEAFEADLRHYGRGKVQQVSILSTELLTIRRGVTVLTLWALKGKIERRLRSKIWITVGKTLA